MNITPLVSVIISTYNSEKYIKGRIENLLSQTIAEKIEIIIINSGSQQNEKKIITPFLKEYPNIIYFETKERETIYKAWNRGIRKAGGKFITNANTDDRLRRDAFEILSIKLSENSETALVYADQFIVNKANVDYEKAHLKNKCYFPDFNRIYLLERCIIGSQPMWRASLHFKDNIWFDENFEVCGDHDFELKVAEKYKILHIKEFLGYFYKSPEKKNKEYENPNKTMSEVEKITKTYVESFIKNTQYKKLISILNSYKKWTIIPIPLYILLKRIINFLDKNIYPRYFFHTIEFNYYLISSILIQLEKSQEAIKYCKKYLRYKKSEKIKDLLNSLTKLE